EPNACALDEKLICCDGLGYKIQVAGPVVQAGLCTCLKSCPACYGQAQRVTAAGAQPCRQPSPVRIIGTINAATVPSRYGAATLEGFANFTGNGEKVLKELKEWLKTYDPRSSKGLVIGGPTG